MEEFKPKGLLKKTEEIDNIKEENFFSADIPFKKAPEIKVFLDEDDLENFLENNEKIEGDEIYELEELEELEVLDGLEDSDLKELEKMKDFSFKRNDDLVESNYGGLEEAFDEETTGDKINKIYSAMSNLIKEKNKRYGNSVMEPLGIFNSHVDKKNNESLNGILIRLDDKLKRIKNSEVLRKNDVSDLMGYLAFLCADKGWTDFSDLID